MKKYLNIFYNNATTPPVLINASNIMMIKQGSANTTTEIIYNADAGADTIVLTHAADAAFDKDKSKKGATICDPFLIYLCQKRTYDRIGQKHGIIDTE